MRTPWKRKRSSSYSTSRHAEVTRRSALQYGAVAGAGLVIAACGNDEDVLRDVSIALDDAPTTSSTPTTLSTATPVSTAPGATVATESSSTTTTTTTDVVVALPGTAIADGSEMVIVYTYEQGAGGKNTSPYTAVWIEDAAGALVQTVALWMEQGRKGVKYLPDLTRWFGVDQDRIASGGIDTVDAMSGPTRFPGQHSVVWNGQSDTLGTVRAGDYFVCIESAREDGPHSLIREPIALAGQPFDLALPDDGELIDASVSVA